MKRKTVVTYTLSECIKCLKCIKSCPVSALTMVKDRVKVNQSRCINCGHCIQACHNKGMLAKGSTLEDIKSYDYTVCMVPSAMTSMCSTLHQAQEIFNAIKMLGFDEVIDLSKVEGQMMRETQILSESVDSGNGISSHCPVINRLIETQYPMLIDHILPKIRENQHVGTLDVHFSREGLQYCNPAVMLQKDDFLIADGFDKVSSILSMEEFGLLDSFRMMCLFPCFNGCIGGHLLWGNSYLSRNNIDALTHDVSEPITDFPLEYLYTPNLSVSEGDDRSLQEKMEFFRKVNEQLEKLPGYDCSACGMQTCRIMAEEIVKGNKTINDCRIHASMQKEKSHDH
ncbi:MAG: 4Fe-4S dicluster domain-containing protein [Erysipelotrichia bacterium]|nr:4Fe-4S dicluster domain-containing protein [Erysipelotrichia bacterium]